MGWATLSVTVTLLASAVLADANSGPRPSTPPPLTKLNGVNFLNGQWSAPGYETEQAVASLWAFKSSTSGNAIAVTYCSFQENVDAVGPIYSRPSTPTDESVSHIVHQAHSFDMAVLLRPCVDPDWSKPGTAGTWRGMIGRHFSASDWDTWFAHYSKLILSQAQLAESLSVEVFAVGMELIQASHQTKHFQRLIKQVRGVYSGALTYCANAGNENFVQFWNELDFISVDAYYPLAPSNPNPTEQQVVQAWQPIVESLKELSYAHATTPSSPSPGELSHPGPVPKPVFFAEIGYCSNQGTNVAPAQCSGTPSPVLDLGAQATMYSAMFRVFYDKQNSEWFAGAFWWSWLTETASGGVSDTKFTPRGKPAADVMKKNFERHSDAVVAGVE